VTKKGTSSNTFQLDKKLPSNTTTLPVFMGSMNWASAGASAHHREHDGHLHHDVGTWTTRTAMTDPKNARHMFLWGK
jgi:hypothetical protein